MLSVSIKTTQQRGTSMKILAAILTFFIVSCAHHKHQHHHMGKYHHKKHHMSKHKSKLSVDTHSDWGNLKTVNSMHGHIYTSGQPNQEAIERFRKEGGQVVINLRQKSEKGFEIEEQSWVERRGMKYYHMPINGEKIQKEDLDKIEKIVKTNSGSKTLVHCSTASRAGAWFSYHAFQRHKDSAEKALKVGEAMGMSSEKVKAQVSNLLK